MRFIAFTLFLFLLPQQGFAENISGLYKTVHDNGIIVGKPAPEDAHDFPDIDLSKCSDTQCIEEYESFNTLGLLELHNGDLKFGTDLSYFNGHSCGLSGVAARHDDGWLFVENNAKEDDDDFMRSHLNCALHIRIDEEAIILNAPPEASCRMYCGARGHFHDVRFPLSSKESSDITREEIDCIGIISEECAKLITGK